MIIFLYGVDLNIINKRLIYLDFLLMLRKILGEWEVIRESETEVEYFIFLLFFNINICIHSMINNSEYQE